MATSSPSARLEARLALYAQYAALARDEVVAAWSADPGQAAGVPRALADARAALAEQYDEMRSVHRGDGSAAFGEAYGDAVAELDAHLAHDLALRAYVAGAARGTLLPAPARSGSASDAEAAGAVAAVEAERLGDELASLGGALVEARAAGIGGSLDGRFPGVDPASYGVDGDAAHDGGARRLDVRF